MVYIQMNYSESSEKHRRTKKRLPGENYYKSLFSLMTGNPYDMGLPCRNEPCRRNNPKTAPLLVTETRNKEKEVEVSVVPIDITVLPRAEFILTFLKNKKCWKRMELVTLWPNTPLLGMTTPYVEESKLEFLQWSKSLWSNRRQDWFSYVIFRSADRGSCDRYWIPPFAHPSKSLRSNKEVYGYLLKGVEYMQLKGLEKTAVLTDNDFF
jgi:hypothetical protein